MDILQFTLSPSYPPQKGGSHRDHGLLASFLAEDDNIHRISFGPLENYKKLTSWESVEISDNYTENRYINPIYDAAKSPAIFGYPRVFLKNALAFYQPKKMDSLISWADVILVEGPWLLPTLRDISPDSFLVFSSHNVERERFGNLPESVLGSFFYKRVVELERQSVIEADLVVCASERDKRMYLDEYSTDTPHIVVPNSTSEDKIDKYTDGSTTLSDVNKESNTLDGIFVGSKHPPNVRGLKYLIELLDDHEELKNKIRLCIIGDVGEEIDQSHSFIKNEGFVDDLDPYYRQADFCVNPITSGGGSNIKMFEYLATGLPVITTPFGARGLDIVDKQEAIIVPIDTFPDSICWLIDHQKRSIEIGKQGQEYVRQHHTWEAASKAYREIIFELL